MVHAVPRALAVDMADDRRAGEIEVADAVERLVAHELVAVAQPALVEHLLVVERESGRASCRERV